MARRPSDACARRRRGLSVSALVLAVLGGVALPVGASTGPSAPQSSLEDQIINLVDAVGWDAPLGATRALDRGFSGTQVLAAVQSGGMEKDGTLTTTRGGATEVTPTFAPEGVLAENGGNVSARQVKKDLRASLLQFVRVQSKREAQEYARVKALVWIIAAALSGYTAEQIIVDGILGDTLCFGPCWGSAIVADPTRPTGADGVVIIDSSGKTIAPRRTVVKPTSALQTLEDLFVEAMEDPAEGSEPAEGSATSNGSSGQGPGSKGSSSKSAAGSSSRSATAQFCADLAAWVASPTPDVATIGRLSQQSLDPNLRLRGDAARLPAALDTLEFAARMVASSPTEYAQQVWSRTVAFVQGLAAACGRG